MKQRLIPPALLALTLSLLFVSCRMVPVPEQPDGTEAPETNPITTVAETDPPPPEGSLGLAYEVSGEGECVVTGIGGCTDQAIRVPTAIDGLTVVGIAPSAFRDNTDIVSLVLPEGLQTIGADAFSGCLALKTVSLPASLNNIGRGAFLRCSALESATFADGIGWQNECDYPYESLADSAFAALVLRIDGDFAFSKVPAAQTTA